MKIQSVRMVLSAGSARECPTGDLAEFAVSGRSNVGKSSLLNSLFGRKDLVMVSGTPGKTQRLNYFMVNERFHVVDLPGYGYARAPDAVRDQWRRMMQQYLRTRRQIAGIIQLLDARHEPSREDRDMVQWLRDESLAFCLVATKMDKLRQGERHAALRTIARALDVPETQPFVPYSSHTGEGRAALLAWIGEVLEAVSGAPGPDR